MDYNPAISDCDIKGDFECATTKFHVKTTTPTTTKITTTTTKRTTPTSTKTTTPTNTKRTTTTKDPFTYITCKKSGEIHPDIYDCHYYFICSSELKPKPVACGYGMDFNSDISACDVKGDFECHQLAKRSY